MGEREEEGLEAPGSAESSILGLQRTVAGLSAAFAQPCAQLLQSLENSNRMMASLNGLLERFVLHSLHATVSFDLLPPSVATAFRARLVYQNNSELPIEGVGIVVTAASLSDASAAPIECLRLAPHTLLPNQRVTIELPTLSSFLSGHIQIGLPSPGTLRSLTKTISWQVPSPFLCLCRVYSITTALSASSASTPFSSSASISASLLRTLFSVAATSPLLDGAAHEYRFTLPSGASVATFVHPIDSPTQISLVSDHPEADSLFNDLITLSQSF